jgi:hypothetical protein
MNPANTPSLNPWNFLSNTLSNKRISPMIKKTVFENEKYLAETVKYSCGQVNLNVTNKETQRTGCADNMHVRPWAVRILETIEDEEKIRICRLIVRS